MFRMKDVYQQGNVEFHKDEVGQVLLMPLLLLMMMMMMMVVW